MVDTHSLERAERRFSEEVFEATDRAMSVGATEKHHLDVAGVPVQLEFANQRMSAILMPALRHIEDDPETSPHPEVRLQAWDSTSTGIEMPPPPVPRNSFTDRGDLAGFGSDRKLIAFHFSEFAVCLLDRDARRGVYWVNDVGDLPFWVRSSPLRTLLHWVLMDRNRHLIHGAVVGDTDAGVLLVGRGGSGKSSTALRCLAAGMTYLGDDYVAVAADPPRAYSLYSTAKLSASQPPIAGRPLMTPAPGEEKVVFTLDDYGPRLKRQAPIRALVALRFWDHAESAVETVDREALLHAAMFTTLAQLPHAGAPLHRLMRDLTNRVPAMRLRLGRDADSVVSIVRKIAGGARLPIAAAEPELLPLVSVVIPVHNGAPFLAAAVASVLAQEYPAVELIVVDDGSTDDLAGAVAQLPVDVTFVRQPRQGPAAARNTGIRASRGDLLAFLDVDDLLPPGSLEKLVRCLIEEDDDVVIGWAQMARFDESTSQTTEYGNPEASFPYYIGAGLYRRSVFDSVGVFDTAMLYAEDVDWFARFHESGRKLRRIPMATLIVRRHRANMTRGKDLVELHMVRALKKSLDRRRAREGPSRA